MLRRGMKKATDKAVEALKDMSQKVKGKEQIAKVAACLLYTSAVGKASGASGRRWTTAEWTIAYARY